MSKFLRDIYDIRVKPEPAPAREQSVRRCAWGDCDAAGLYRAPKSRERLHEYQWLCLDHVRRYNAAWNFFAGMDETEVERYTRENVTGHRPTWRMGAERFGQAARAAGARIWERPLEDSFGLFERPSGAPGAKPAQRERPRLPAVVLRALATLGLDEMVPRQEIKARYKLLVKRYHPDANGGDRTAEERLREVIQAYQQLKAGGFC